MFSEQGHRCAVHLLDLFFIFLGAGGSDPEYGTTPVLSRDLSMCLYMSEISIAGRSLWISLVVRTRFSLSRHGDINVVNVH